ncbi:hypothetical protein [Kitasatospora sp. NPDC097643]|uniref:hypothetical protein n=1 Tax=Kitasatospora sp. NPDC097643 TaxID=3157230 RepID=UPI003321F102
MKKIIVTGMLVLASATLAAPAHASGGSAVPGVDSLPLNNLASAGKDPLNSIVASDSGTGGLTSGLSNLEMITGLLTGLLKGAPISGAATPGADASGKGAGSSSPLGSASPLSSLTGGGDKGSPLSSLTGGLNGLGLA